MKWVEWLLAAALIIWLLAPNPARLRGRAGADVSDDLVKTKMSFDRNGDGFLTPEEIRTLAKAQALPDRR
jgi:hypothetical protein